MGNVLAGFGKTYAIISAIFVSIISVIIIALGIFAITNQDGVPPSEQNARKTTGWTLIIIGVIILVIAWLLVILTQRSKAAAEIYGGLGVINLGNDIQNRII